LILWEKGLWYLTMVLTAAVLGKLWATGLLKIYKLLFCYLAIDLLSSIAASAFSYDTYWYGIFYFTCQTLKVILAGFVLREVYALALERTPALAQFGRSSIGLILAAAALIPVIVVLADNSSSPHSKLQDFLMWEQTISATVAIFLILISMFAAWFPVRLKRNVIVYVGGFVMWSMARATAAHFMNQWSGNTRVGSIVNSVDMCVCIGCLLLWLIGLQPEGESRTAVVGHLWNRAEAERLTEQLDAINDSLERLRRR
jgi:hypothetical protein